jgi:hemolysin III
LIQKRSLLQKGSHLKLKKILNFKGRKKHPIMHKIKVGNRFVLKEPVSTLSHFAGALVAVVAFVSLFFLPKNDMKTFHFIGFLLYFTAMFGVFMASAVYHGYPANIRWQKFLNRVDHAMIYIFIAGTYVPIFLVGAPPATGIPIVLIVSLCAMFGTYLEVFAKKKNKKLGAAMYVLMGWIAVFGLKALFATLPERAVQLIFVGGVLYTVGALFYALKAPNFFPRILGFHELFHFFVLAGALCHFWSIWFYIMPIALTGKA